MKIEVIRHVPYVYYGNLEPWIRAWGVDVWERRFFQSSVYPKGEAPDLCIVLGGPMGVYEKQQHPWLREEMQHLEMRLKEGTKILAICLGAQLFAEILGAKVSKAEEPEVGWHAIRVAKEAKGLDIVAELPREWVSFHWHNDVFELPSGAKHLFESEAYSYQGYLYNDQLLATQFHPEMNEEGAKNLLWRFGSNLDYTRKWIQKTEEMKAGFIHECKNVSILHALVDKLCG